MNYRIYCFGLLLLQSVFRLGMQNDSYVLVEKKKHKKREPNPSNTLVGMVRGLMN